MKLLSTFLYTLPLSTVRAADASIITKGLPREVVLKTDVSSLRGADGSSALLAAAPSTSPPQVCFCTPHGMKKARDWGKKSCEQLGCPSITDPKACHNKYFQPKYPSKVFCKYRPATAAPSTSLSPTASPPQVCFCTPHGMRKARDWGRKSCEQLGCPSITDPKACHNKYFQPKYPSKVFCKYRPVTTAPSTSPSAEPGSVIGYGATASQQSTCYGGHASKAIDGNTNGNWRSGSVQHTCGSANPWWMVDLGREETYITSVVVYNRSDCCQDRLGSTDLEILDAASNVVASEPFEGVEDEYHFRFSNVVGRFVRVNRRMSGVINIAEVDVFGHYVSPSAAPSLTSLPTVEEPISVIGNSATASQQSTCYGGHASKAIDGDTNGNWRSGSVQHTCASANPWWMVDLGMEETYITNVVVYNRSDCCKDRLGRTDLEILDAASNVVASKPFEGVEDEYRFRFGNVVGRFVRVNRKTWGVINIAEVDVFGHSKAPTIALPLVVTSGMDAGYLGKTIGRDVWTDIYANNQGAALGLLIIDHNSDGAFQLKEGGDEGKCLSRKNKNDNNLYWLNMQPCDANNEARAFTVGPEGNSSVRLVNINTNHDGANFCLAAIGGGRLVLKRSLTAECAGFATADAV